MQKIVKKLGLKAPPVVVFNQARGRNKSFRSIDLTGSEGREGVR